MFYIIGLHHSAQASTDGHPQTDDQRRYAEHLRQLINNSAPCCIAEEDSKQALAARRKFSIARTIASSSNIEHRFCDPTQEQRQEIGYVDDQTLQLSIFMYDKNRNMSQDEVMAKARAVSIGKYWAIRERFWLEQLRDVLERDLVFVCGGGHTETFSQLLKERNIAYEITARDIGVTDQDHYEMEQGRKYLDAHPDVIEEY